MLALAFLRRAAELRRFVRYRCLCNVADFVDGGLAPLRRMCAIPPWRAVVRRGGHRRVPEGGAPVVDAS